MMSGTFFGDEVRLDNLAEAKVLVGGLAEGIQSLPAAKLLRLQADSSQGPYGRNIHSRAVALIGG